MKAYELLSSPEKWTKNSIARDQRGYAVNPSDPSAKSFCMIGAIEKCYGANTSHFNTAYDLLTRVILKKRGLGRIANFNDDPKTTFKQVQAWLKEADV